MKHFLVTRFNLKTEDWKFAVDGSEVLTDEWLKNRWQLFETFCLPSVINQSNNNFIWTVFFDTQTDEYYKKKINELSLTFSNFKPIYIDSMNLFQSKLKEFIHDNCDDNDKQIITTRLDNDDIIHESFISRIQSLASKAKDNTVIDLRKGYQMQLKKTYLLKEISLAFNPFISVVENSNNFETIITKQHLEWKKNTTIISDDQSFLWVQIIHSKNKLNTILKSFYFVNKTPKGFSLESNYKKANETKLFLKNAVIFLRNSLKTLLIPTKKES